MSELGSSSQPNQMNSKPFGPEALKYTDNSHHDVENGQPKEPGLVPVQKTVWTVQERLAYLEEEYYKLIAAKGANQSIGHVGNEEKEIQPEIDYAQYVPVCEVTRICSDDWREVKKGKFAVPERTVVTVVSRQRSWTTGSRLVLDNHHEIENGVVEDISATSTPMIESSTESPHRVAITGHDLHRALEKIINCPLSLINNVWVWPFKYFIVYETEIRKCLENEEAKFNGSAAPQQNGSNVLSAIENNISENGSNIDRREDITKLPEGQSTDDKSVETRLRDQLRCLVAFMDHDMKETFSIKRKIADGTLQNIAFEHLWQLYSPGDLIFSSEQNTERRAYRVLHVTGGRTILDTDDQPPAENQFSSSRPVRSWERHGDQAIAYAHSKNTSFVIDCFYIDFDGQNFGPVPRRFVIPEFEGERPINTLHAFPAKFDKNNKETEKLLIKRGKRFYKLAGVTHKRYVGLSARDPSVFDYQDEVNSEVVIDFELAVKHFRRNIKDWDVGLGAGVIEKATRADAREINEIRPCPIKDCRLCKTTDIFDDFKLDLERRSRFLDSTRLLQYRPYKNENLSNDQCMLLPPRVYGYALLDRKWYPLNIDLVEDIEPNSANGFDDLVLPGDHKRIMQALVKNHNRGTRPTLENDEFSDFSMDLVRGKGKGLIILLHGVPGVGKTSTAECVAAQTGRPLFPITCGDIGTTSTEVEKCLENYFDLAHKWGCVLLLDEADVYLASRERGGDLQRNSLVSVFLRVLEYYSGILILTTNRVGEFDEAFKSRIHMSLYYPKLDRESTMKIWDMNLAQIRRNNINIDVNEANIRKFAKEQWSDSKKRLTRRWNGRQIKNAFQIAIALAKWDFNDEKKKGTTDLEKPLLTEKQFRVVSQTSAHFDDYISKMHGIDEDDTYAMLAERETLRKDSVASAAATGRKGSSFSPGDRSKAARRIAYKGESTDDDDESEDEDEDESENNEQTDEDDEKKIQRLQLELELQKLKGRKKLSAKEKSGGSKDNNRETSSRKTKKITKNSLDSSENE